MDKGDGFDMCGRLRGREDGGGGRKKETGIRMEEDIL